MNHDPGDARPYGRRAFLLLLAGGLSSLGWATKASNVFSPLTSGFSQLVGNLLPVGGWRIYTISGSMPEFDPKAWRLEIDGLVGKPRSFTYQELRALPRAHQVSDFHCVTGWTVHGVRWSGVRFAHLLDVGLREVLRVRRDRRLRWRAPNVECAEAPAHGRNSPLAEVQR